MTTTHPSAPHRILVIIGTPLPDTLNHSLAHAYIDAARASGAHVEVVDLAHDPSPDHPRVRNQLRAPRHDGDVALDPIVARYIASVDAADHLTFFFPQWWGGVPAALKSWLDRVLLTGFAYRYHPRGKGWDRMLAGRTARILTTSDSPTWWSRLVYRDASVRALKTATLWYCGVSTVGTTRISEVRHSTPERLGKAIAAIKNLGTADARRTLRTKPTRASAKVDSLA